MVFWTGTVWYGILHLWTCYPSTVSCSLSVTIATVLFSWTDFVILSLCGSFLTSIFVFGILQIPSGCCHIFSWCIALTFLPVQRDLTEYPSWGFSDFSQPLQTNGLGLKSGHDRFLPNPSPLLHDFFPYHSTLQSGILIAWLKWTISSLIIPYKITIRSLSLPVTLSILLVT
jgi:hypothetical protein